MAIVWKLTEAKRFLQQTAQKLPKKNLLFPHAYEMIIMDFQPFATKLQGVNELCHKEMP